MFRGPSSESRAYNSHLVARQRQADASIANERARLNDNTAHIAAKSDVTSRNRRRMNAMTSMQREQVEKEEYERHQRLQKQRFQQRMAEDRISKDIESRRRKAVRDEKLLQLVHEQSDELRDLDLILRAAEVAKSREVQLQESIAKREAQREEDLYLGEQTRVMMTAAKEREAAQEQEILEARVQHGLKLRDQMYENEEMKMRAAMDQFERERLEVDRIINNINLAQQVERDITHQKKTRVRADMKAFTVARNAKRAEESARMAAEERAAAEYVTQVDERKMRANLEVAARNAEKQVIFDAMASKMEAEEKERMDFENIQTELYIQEKEVAERAAEQETMRRRISKRLELVEAHKEMVALREERNAQEKAEEEQYRQQLVMAFENDERLAQKTRAAQARQRAQFREDVTKLIEERRVRREEERREMMKAEADLDKYDKVKRAVIEQERRRMLQERAMAVLGYLPAGVIKETDLDLFPEEVRSILRQAAPQAEDY